MNNNENSINHNCDECIAGFQLFSWSASEERFLNIRCIKDHLKKNKNEHRNEDTP